MQQGYALDAISAVARQGEKQFRLIILAIFIVIVTIVAILVYREVKRPPELAKWPVAVLLPKTEEGSVRDNALRQWEGFELAFADNSVSGSDNRHVYEYNYPLNTGDVEEIDSCETTDIEELAKQNDVKAMLQQIKCWYGIGIRTFIVTMSGAVTGIRKDFTEWAETLDANDRPVLLATVASAPDIADRKNGVFRHYIRSRDESDTLATYVESMNPYPGVVGIFHVPDSYGRRAMHLLKTRLEKHGWVGVYKVPFDEDETLEETNEKIDEFLGDEGEVAVIIGYGPMIKNTLNSLMASRQFNGPVLVVSTFTEESWWPEWEPEDECFVDQIRYIEPITDHEETDTLRRGVVFQFSYLTLDRALKCRDKRGVEDFWSCFTDAQKLSASGKLWNPQLEFTEDGDSHISLRLYNMDNGEHESDQCHAEPEPEPPPE